MTDVEDVMAAILERTPPVPPGDPNEEPSWKREERQEAAEKRDRAVRAALKDSELPERILERLRGGGLLETPALAALREPSTITVLSGLPGCGKSMAAGWWLYSWATESMGAGLWVTAARLSRWSRYDTREMDRLIRVPRLVLDDLGTEYIDEKGSFMATLDEVINERYAGKRPLVITTNLNAADWRERYGERISDRIREAGAFKTAGSLSLRSTKPHVTNGGT